MLGETTDHMVEWCLSMLTISGWASVGWADWHLPVTKGGTTAKDSIERGEFDDLSELV